MTSMAVTAIIRASASEAALLVASFMPFSLDSGLRIWAWVTQIWTRFIAARKGPTIRIDLLGTPLDEYSL
jgi:hypothetical protein